MADLDFSSSAEPIASKNAPDFSQNADPVRSVSPAENLGRGFVSGGGDLLNLISGIGHAVNPADAIAQRMMTQDALSRGLPADQIKAALDPAASLAQNAHDYAALTPTETTDLSGKVAGGVGRAIPSIAAAIGTGGGASLETALPAAVRSVPVLGRLAGALAGGAPTATVLTAEQAANLPDNISDADKAAAIAKAGGVNLALAGLPVAIGGGAVTRAVTGGALGYGTSAAASAIQGQPQDQANNIVGALMGAALGQRPSTPQIDPHLAQYQASVDTPFTPAARPELPAPVAPVEANGPIPSAQATFSQESTPVVSPAQHAEAFHADPRAALDKLDHPTLVQLADDAGLDVSATEKRVSIISKLAGLPKQSMTEDVLPGYLDAVGAVKTPSVPTAESVTPSIDTVIPVSPLAKALSPGQTVSVDQSGTAFTPEQGGTVLANALQGGMQQLATPALPAPVTTVDTQGNAVDSGAFTRAIQERQAAMDQQAAVAGQRANLGLTPDIERINAPRWKQQELANRQSALDVSDRQAIDDYRQPDELSTQRMEDIPGEFSDVTPLIDAGRRAHADYADQGELATQRSEDIPPEPQWWEAGQRAQEAHDAEIAQLQGDRQAMAPEQRQEAAEALNGAGIEPHDHEEALATTQLLERAYDAGASSGDVRKAIDTEDSAEAADNLRSLTHDLESRHAYEIAPNEIESSGAQAPNQGGTGTRSSAPIEGTGTESSATRSSDIPGNGRSSGRERPSRRVAVPESTDGFGTPASWIIRNKETGEPVMETFERKTAERINHEKYEAVPVAKHLQESNRPGTRAYSYARREEVSGHPAPEITEQPPRVEEGAQHIERGPSVHESKQRSDWTPKTDEAASKALDDLVQRYGGSTLADSFSDSMREHTTAQLIGQTIHSPEDLAALASVYRSPAFETMRYVYTDRDGLILGETAVSSRMPSSSVTFPLGETSTEGWINKNKPSGATKVWMIHNHPTADPRASRADVAITQKMSIKLGDMLGAPKLAGHVILDHDTYGFIDALGEDRGVHTITSKLGTNDPTRTVSGDQRMFDVPVTSPEFAAITGKRISAATPENSSAVVTMAADGTVNSIHTFPNDFLMSPKGAAMLGRIAEKRGATGIGLVTSTSNFAKHRAAFDQAGKRGLFRDAIVVNNEGHALRLNDSALFPREHRGPPMSRSKAVYRRNDVGSKVMEGENSNMSLSAVRQALLDRGESPERVQSMTPSELREEKANLRARSAPTPAQAEALKSTDESGKVTGVKNATKEEERAMRGKAAVEHDLSTSNPEQYARAKERFDADPHAGQILAAKVVADKKAIEPEESIILALDAMRIQNARQSAYEQAQAAMARGDEATRVAAMSLAHQLDGQMEINDMASRYSGVRAGQILQARKVMIQQDYSMARLLLRAKVAKGADLTASEKSSLEAKAAEIAKRTKELDEREAKLRAMEAEAKPVQQKRQAKAKFDDLVAQLKKIPQDKHLKDGCIV